MLLLSCVVFSIGISACIASESGHKNHTSPKIDENELRRLFANWTLIFAEQEKESMDKVISTTKDEKVTKINLEATSINNGTEQVYTSTPAGSFGQIPVQNALFDNNTILQPLALELSSDHSNDTPIESTTANNSNRPNIQHILPETLTNGNSPIIKINSSFQVSIDNNILSTNSQNSTNDTFSDYTPSLTTFNVPHPTIFPYDENTTINTSISTNESDSDNNNITNISQIITSSEDNAITPTITNSSITLYETHSFNDSMVTITTTPITPNFKTFNFRVASDNITSTTDNVTESDFTTYTSEYKTTMAPTPEIVSEDIISANIDYNATVTITTTNPHITTNDTLPDENPIKTTPTTSVTIAKLDNITNITNPQVLNTRDTPFSPPSIEDFPDNDNTTIEPALSTLQEFPNETISILTNSPNITSQVSPNVTTFNKSPTSTTTVPGNTRYTPNQTTFIIDAPTDLPPQEQSTTLKDIPTVNLPLSTATPSTFTTKKQTNETISILTTTTKALPKLTTPTNAPNITSHVSPNVTTFNKSPTSTTAVPENTRYIAKQTTFIIDAPTDRPPQKQSTTLKDIPTVNLPLSTATPSTFTTKKHTNETISILTTTIKAIPKLTTPKNSPNITSQVFPNVTTFNKSPTPTTAVPGNTRYSAKQTTFIIDAPTDLSTTEPSNLPLSTTTDAPPEKLTTTPTSTVSQTTQHASRTTSVSFLSAGVNWFKSHLPNRFVDMIEYSSPALINATRERESFKRTWLKQI